MKIIQHPSGDDFIAEIIGEGLIIQSEEEAKDLLMTICFDGSDRLILYQKNITADFFDLSTRLAGNVLQHFSNFRAQLAIVGSFENIVSQSLQDFIYESNKGKRVYFAESLDEALKALS